MKELAILLRSMQLYGHNAHNLVARIVFFSDHEFLGELYKGYEDDYDDVVERIIGLTGSCDLLDIQLGACEVLKTLPLPLKENGQLLEQILLLEKHLCQKIDLLSNTPGISQGTIQLIGDIANKSEVRQYKLQQRLKK